MSYVYCLIDPRNGLPFYVGKGTGYRYKTHLRENKNNTINIRKFYKIQSIRNAGLEPIVEIIKDKLSTQEALALEISLITKYGRKDIDPNGILMNIAPGGEGNTDGRLGKPHKTVSKEKIAAARAKQAPHTFTEQEKYTLSLKIKEWHNNKTNEEKRNVNQKISAANKGVKKPDGHCTSNTRELRMKNQLGKKLHPITRKWISIDEYNAFISQR